MSRYREPVVLSALALIAGLIAGLGSTQIAPTREATIAVFAIGFAVGFGLLGRHDLTRPHVAMPLVWYSAVAVSQMKLLRTYETDWSTETVGVVFSAPIAFALGSYLVCNDAVRPVRAAGLGTLRESRLRTCAAVLLVLGAVGVAWKTSLTGGIPLLADQIDSLRSAGGIRIPAYVTFLTDCLYLSAWLWMLLVWLRHKSGRSILFDVAMVVVALAGVATAASRNTLLLTLTVPLIFAYLAGAFRTLRPMKAAAVTALAVLALLVASGLFYVRTGQHAEASFESYFYSSIVADAAPVARPMLPLYVGLATPLETLNRVIAHFPSNDVLDDGVFSVPGIPAQLNPLGEPGDFYELTGALSSPYYFNVATYTGAPYADGGALLVLLASLGLGLGFGAARRYCFIRVDARSFALAAYLTYVAIFLFYENLLAFYTLSVVWDALLIAAVMGYCTSPAEMSTGVRL